MKNKNLFKPIKSGVLMEKEIPSKMKSDKTEPRMQYFSAPAGKTEQLLSYLALSDPSSTVSVASNGRIGIFNSHLSRLTIESIIKWFKPTKRTNPNGQNRKAPKSRILEYNIPPQYTDAIATLLSAIDSEAVISIRGGAITIESHLNPQTLKEIFKHPEEYQLTGKDFSPKKKFISKRMPPCYTNQLL